MKTSHKVFMASAATLPFIGLAGGAVYAAQGTPGGYGDTMADKIATRFNLKSDDVKAVFSEERTARQAEMRERATTALKTAGFTDTQITALQNKQSEQRESMKTWRDANPNATREDMQSRRDSQKTAMETWAKEQGIDLAKVHDTLKSSIKGHMGGNELGRGMGNGEGNEGDAPHAYGPAN